MAPLGIALTETKYFPVCRQVLCAVGARAAPLAAKSARAAELELAQPLTSSVPSSPLELKLSKLKKFRASDEELKSGKKAHVLRKLEDATTERTPAPSIATSEPTTAPLVAAEESSPLPERDVELLKSHIEPRLVASPMFEDEKASRFRHSTLLGFPSFF